MRFYAIRGESAPELCLQLGLGLLVSVAAAFVLAAMYFAIGCQLAGCSAPIRLAMSFVAALGAMGLYGSRSVVLSGVVLLAIYVASIVVAGALYETTIDGQDYHFQAVYALAKGWNPFYHGYE